MKIIRLWTPAIVWMSIIYFFSSNQRVEVTPNDAINFIFFKTLHVIEFAILFILLARAIGNTFKTNRKSDIYLLVFFITILYAMSDEIHQTFVPTREGKLRDVIIDAIGAILAWYSLINILPKAPKKLRDWAKSWQLA